MLTQVNSNDKTLIFQGKIPFDIGKRSPLCAAPLFVRVVIRTVKREFFYDILIIAINRGILFEKIIDTKLI